MATNALRTNLDQLAPLIGILPIFGIAGVENHKISPMMRATNPPQPRMLKLHFSDQSRNPIWMMDKSFSIGSAPDNDLVITDPLVSPMHARLQVINGVYTLQDLGSQTGTFVNGQRTVQKPVQHGDTVRIGNAVMEVRNPTMPGSQSHWTLVASSSWLAGQEFPLPSGNAQIKVGRASHCGLIFPGTHLSREHALLTLSEQCVQVKDLGSANGTFINDERISEGTLYSGDLLRLDVYSFRIFGPGIRPTKSRMDEATRLRPVPDINKTIPDTEPPVSPKRWKTRPTSPGNRSEIPVSSGQYNRLTIWLAVFLGTALAGLAVYLLFG